MQVADTMATHTTGAAHDLSGDELALVLDAACAVVFHLDVASGDVRWSGPVAALTGAGEPPATFETFLGCVHPDDRADLHAAVAATAHDGATSTRDLRLVWPDGSTHWLQARWRLVPEERAQRRSSAWRARSTTSAPRSGACASWPT